MAEVQIDTTKLVRAGKQLTTGLTRGGKNAAQRQASQTADRVRGGVPVRTGLLASTVGVTADGEGYGVTYGGGLRYAGYIENRNHPVGLGVKGAAEEFVNTCNQLAGEEVRKI